MPRRFTREEEDAIRTALLGAGRRIMGARGVRKTSIDELVREAGISKGSFYRFFPGKEALALDVLAGWEREFHQGIHDLFRTAEPRGVDETAAVLSAVFLEEFPRRVGESGLQGLMQPEEIAYLARAEAAGAGADRRRTMDEQDLRFYAELKPLLHAAGLAISEEDAVVMAGLRLLFDAALGILAAPSDRSGSPLESDHFRAAFTLLIRGLLSQACNREERGDA
jgi:AcrR family transcriptional regulator